MMKTMNYTHEDWATAPKDGSVINVQFPDGIQAKARWSTDGAPLWEVLRGSGDWVSMEYDHGRQPPSRWWH